MIPCLTALLALTAGAAPIDIADFSGSETVLDMSTATSGSSTSFGGTTWTTALGTLSPGSYGNMYNFPGASGGVALYDNAFDSDVEIAFDVPQNRVGLLLSGGNSDTSWTVSIHDSSGAELESTVVYFTFDGPWPDEPPVWVGFESVADIHAMQIVEAGDNSQYTGFDDLRFEAADVMPALLWSAVELAVGDADCPYGGVRLDSGLDDGDGAGTAGDGVLDDDEIDDSEFICNGAPGDLLEMTALPVGDADCPDGGVRIDAGSDDGAGDGTANDGELHPDEIDDSEFVCNGADGADGVDGADGAEGAEGRQGPVGPAGPPGVPGGCSTAGGSTSWLVMGLLMLGVRRRR